MLTLQMEQHPLVRLDQLAHVAEVATPGPAAPLRTAMLGANETAARLTHALPQLRWIAASHWLMRGMRYRWRHRLR